MSGTVSASERSCGRTRCVVPRRHWESRECHCQAIVHCWFFGLSEQDRRLWMRQTSSDRYSCISCIGFKNNIDLACFYLRDIYVEISCALACATPRNRERDMVIFVFALKKLTNCLAHTQFRHVRASKTGQNRWRASSRTKKLETAGTGKQETGAMPEKGHRVSLRIDASFLITNRAGGSWFSTCVTKRTV